MKLSLEDANQYIELMWGLQRYANRQYKICKDISSPLDYAGLSVQVKLKLRDALWKSPDLIKAYLEANPEGLSSERLEIVRTWTRFM